MTSSNFWRGRPVFLTGHTGFKGSWLAILLSDWGAQVHGYALRPDARSTYVTAGVDALLASSTIADVRDRQMLGDALNASGAEIVFHLAAQPLVRLSYASPVETYATNVMGTVNLLDACRHSQVVRAVVVVTSDKCYDNREWVWGYRETEPMGGHDPYSNSKGCAELVTSAFRASYFGAAGGAQIGTGRAGNVIGGGDYSSDRLMPDLIRSLERNEKARIRNAGAIRPWQHVLEPLSGYVLLAERLAQSGGEAFAEAWNFGPGSTGDQTVRQVIESTYSHWGSGAWDVDKEDHPHEAYYLKLDSSKARKILGWAPRWDFETTIEQTVAWYRAEAQGADMLTTTRNQILKYQSQ